MVVSPPVSYELFALHESFVNQTGAELEPEWLPGCAGSRCQLTIYQYRLLHHNWTVKLTKKIINFGPSTLKRNEKNMSPVKRNEEHMVKRGNEFRCV